MHKMTLVQTSANLEEYQDMILKGQLPLVIRLTNYEIEGNEFSNTPFSELYYKAIPGDGFENQFLHDDRLREAIEEKKIFIPDFIDLDGNTKYVDYISESHSLDFGGHIVFRGKKRLLKGGQARDSIQKNQPHVEYVRMQCGGYSGVVPMVCTGVHDEDSEELFSLCTDVLYHFREKREEPAVQKRHKF